MPQKSSSRDLVLITGSNGLIGTRLQEALVPDYEVFGLDVEEASGTPDGAHWLECDLTSDASVREALAKVRSEFGPRLASVVHLAAYADFSGEPSPLYRKLTVEGSRRLMQALQELDVEQFVFSSSLLVMQPVTEESEPLTETSPTRGEWAYPQSKIEAEKALQATHGDIPLVILRIAGVYDHECHSLPIGQQIRRIYEKQFESFLFPGNTSHGQPFIHLDDLTACLRAVISRRKKLGAEETFLIAEPTTMSYGALQDRIGELVHSREWPTLRIPKAAARAGAWLQQKLPGVDPFIKPWMIELADDHYPVEITRARERLEWTPKHFLSDVLPSMVAELKRNPVEWYEKNKLPLPKALQREAEAARR